MLGPSPIELGRLFRGEYKFFLAFRFGKAFPESHRKFGPIAGGKPQKLRERPGFHGVILSCDRVCHKMIDCQPIGCDHRDPNLSVSGWLFSGLIQSIRLLQLWLSRSDHRANKAR